MRFKQYINENTYNTEVIDIINNLIDKCSPFLKELSKNKFNNFMYSGRDVNKSVFIGKVRKDRRPSDTSYYTHNTLDKLFNDKFGWKARSNAIFCTGFKNSTQYYGKPYLIFPIGKYKFIWSSKIYDLYTDELSDLDKITTDYDILDKYHQEIQDEIHKRLKDNHNSDKKQIIKDVNDVFIKDSKTYYNKKLQDLVNTYTDKNLNQALETSNEIMVNCKTYYAVNQDYYNDISNYFLTYGLSKKGL